MVRTKFYLDTRKSAVCKDVNPLRINITKERKTAALALGINLATSQWDKKAEKVQKHPEAMLLNKIIAEKKVEVDTIILKLRDQGLIPTMTAVQIRDYVVATLAHVDEVPQKPKEDPNTLLIWFEKCMGHKKGQTHSLYKTTLNRLKAWLGEDELAKVKFEDITREWLLNFDDFMAQTAPSANSRGINMRNLRAVCNYAIDNNVTTYYPFRRFKIEKETTRKRNFDVATLRKIFNYQCEEEWQQRYLDAFKLSFMLIGINMVDLCKLTSIKNGRIQYIRSKTKKPYDIKVERETRELLDKYKGEGQLLNFLDTCVNYRHFYNRLCLGLKEIRSQLKLDELTSYYARHTWATIASKLDIPHDTIAHALGHGGHSVTDIYIDFDMSKVDEANRKVLDYVFYGVREKQKKRGRPKKVATPQKDKDAAA